MPNGPLDAGNNAQKGDSAESKNIGGGGGGDDFATKLSQEVGDMAKSTGTGAFGEKNEGTVDKQTDKADDSIQITDGAEQVSDASDNPQELGKMMQESAEKAAQSMDKAGQKFDSLKGTDQEDNAKDIAKFFGEQATKMGLGDVGKNISNGGFKAASDAVKQVAKGYAASANKD